MLVRQKEKKAGDRYRPPAFVGEKEGTYIFQGPWETLARHPLIRLSEGRGSANLQNLNSSLLAAGSLPQSQSQNRDDVK
jgi:hypothetical protein